VKEARLPNPKEPPQTPGEIFAKRVREVRGKRGWKQEQLAERILELKGKDPALGQLNAQRVSVARTEKGERNPTIDDLFLFASALGVSPLELVLPDEDEDEVTLGARRIHAGFLHEWIIGLLPLHPEDVSTYSQHMRPFSNRHTDRLIGEMLEAHEPPADPNVRDLLLAHITSEEKAIETASQDTIRFIEPAIRDQVLVNLNVRRTMITDARRLLEESPRTRRKR
jgi:transcriptional regulator with XRE-family HTH domain